MLRIIIAAIVILIAVKSEGITNSLAGLLGMPSEYLVAAIIALAVTPVVAPWFR